jgi:Zn-finger nucleic acid-binding protein
MILDCPGCHQSYDLSSYKAGQRLRCRCGQIIVVPGRGPEVRAARTLHCNNCGGELKKGQPNCPFCGAVVDLTNARLTAYCPECLSMSKEGAKFCSGCGKPLTLKVDKPKEASEQCPRCKIKMRRRGVGAHETLECPMCCGLFVEVDVMESMIRDQEKRVGEVASPTKRPERSSLNAGPVSYVMCPVCGTVMNRLNYGRISGVIVDYCKKHGYWLDEGELEKIAKWVATGGLQLKYEREAEDAKAEAEAARKQADAINASIRMSGDDFSGGSGVRLTFSGGLLDLVSKLFDK